MGYGVRCMREIKFRAWSKELRKIFEHADIDGLTGEVRFAWIREPKNLKSCAGTHYQWDCIPMQFTGMYDKDGPEIYEGDIVSNLFYFAETAGMPFKVSGATVLGSVVTSHSTPIYLTHSIRRSQRL